MDFLQGFLGLGGYMDYLANMPQQIMDRMWFDWNNIDVFFAWIVGYVTGYLLYTYAGKVAKEQGVQPYPLWIHCYMFSIDLIGTITFWYLFATNDFYWFFAVQGVALPLWMIMEAKSIYDGVRNDEERNFEFGRLRCGGKISQRDAWFYCIGIFVFGFFMNMYALSMLGGFDNAAIWIIYPFTNYVYAVFTWRFWDARSAQFGNRKHNAVGLQVVITVTCFVSWCPGLNWFWAVSPFFHQPWFIVGGIVMTCISAYNLYRCIKLPPYVPGDDEVAAESLPIGEKQVQA